VEPNEGRVIRFPSGQDAGRAARGVARREGAGTTDDAYDRFARAIVDACRGIDDPSERQWLLDALWRSRQDLLDREREGEAIRAGLGARFATTLMDTLRAEMRRHPSSG
jgi:hypothetical protein